MILAIAEDEKMIADHLGHCKSIHFFEISERKVVKDEIVPCTGEGHEYMLRLLKEHKANALVCGRLGKPAIEALLRDGVEIFPALMGDVQEAAKEYLEGTLPQVPVEHLMHACDHHGHEEGHCCCHHGHCEEK